MNLALVFTIGIGTTSNRFDVWAGFLLAKRPRKPTAVTASGNDGVRRAADTGWFVCGPGPFFVRDRERPVTAQKAIGRREFSSDCSLNHYSRLIALYLPLIDNNSTSKTRVEFGGISGLGLRSP